MDSLVARRSGVQIPPLVLVVFGAVGIASTDTARSETSGSRVCVCRDNPVQLLADTLTFNQIDREARENDMDQDAILDEIKSRKASGCTMRDLQRRFGIHDPLDQAENAKVWKLIRLVEGLRYGRRIECFMLNGFRQYYPR